MKTAFLFPGQGAQVVGMGADIAAAFPEAEAVFQEADKIVGFDLSKLCFEGPAVQLNTTTISQPAIFVTSAAILEVLRTSPNTNNIKPDATAGLSLGEYTALYSAGVISFEDALTLVKKRGESMQAAAESTEGGMVSIIGLDEPTIRLLCEEASGGELLVPVNFNCPGQIVISGAKAACERAEHLAEKYGAMKAVRLEVAGAFHTERMAGAAESLKQAIGDSEISEPANVRIVANITGEYYRSAKEIADGLVKQLTSPILWKKCMEKLLSDGVERFYEIGPGRVLTGLMRRINKKADVINLSTLDSLKGLVTIGEQAGFHVKPIG